MTIQESIEEVKRIGAKNGDIILFKTEIPMSNESVVIFSEAIKSHLGIRVLIVNLISGENIETLNEEGMNAAGWYRKTGKDPDGPREARKSIQPTEPWPDPK